MHKILQGFQVSVTLCLGCFRKEKKEIQKTEIWGTDEFDFQMKVTVKNEKKRKQKHKE